MSENSSLKRLQDIMNSRSNDFTELLKISGLDIKKDFVGADLSSVDFGSFDYTLINLHDAIVKNAIYNGRLINKDHLSNENLKETNVLDEDKRGKSDTTASIRQILHTLDWDETRIHESDIFKNYLQEIFAKAFSRRQLSSRPLIRVANLNESQQSDVFSMVKTALDQYKTENEFSSRECVVRIADFDEIQKKWYVKDVENTASVFPSSERFLRATGKHLQTFRNYKSGHKTSYENIFKNLKSNFVTGVNPKFAAIYILLCQDCKYALDVCKQLERDADIFFQIVIIPTVESPTLKKIISQQTYFRSKIVHNNVRLQSRLVVLRKMLRQLRHYGFVFGNVSSRELFRIAQEDPFSDQSTGDRFSLYLENICDQLPFNFE